MILILFVPSVGKSFVLVKYKDFESMLMHVFENDFDITFAYLLFFCNLLSIVCTDLNVIIYSIMNLRYSEIVNN